MKYKLTKAEQETVINFDNELDTASVYTHDSRLIKVSGRRAEVEKHEKRRQSLQSLNRRTFRLTGGDDI